MLGRRNAANAKHPLVKLRLDLNLSQDEIATKCGVKFHSVANWENGRSMPLDASRDVYEELAREKGLPVPNWEEVQNLYDERKRR